MNAKISVFVACVEAIMYICYYTICMTVPLCTNVRLKVTRVFYILNGNGID